MFEVYIIECSDGSYYTGYAKNALKRFEKHLVGKGAAYTRSHKPVRLIYKATFDSKSEALKEEFRIKQLDKKEKNYLVNSARSFCEKSFSK
jgi:putative endonuclease